MAKDSFRYLLKHQPLFNPELAQFNISYSCLAYLNTSVALPNDGYDEDLRIVDVGKGTHRLCQYASKYWVDHFLEYMNAIKGKADSDSKAFLLKAADDLALALTRIIPLSQLDLSQLKLDRRCEVLEGYEPILTMVMSIIIPQITEKIIPKRATKSGECFQPQGLSSRVLTSNHRIRSKQRSLFKNSLKVR